MIPERDVMVCASVALLRDPIPGSQLRRCEQCNEAIWVAPKCEDLVLEQNLMRCCHSCALKLLQTTTDPVIVPVDDDTNAVEAYKRGKERL